jgi:Putative metal-binding motif
MKHRIVSRVGFLLCLVLALPGFPATRTIAENPLLFNDGFETNAPEVCDGVDNDLDGYIDAIDPSLVLVSCLNQNGVCGGALKEASLCTAGIWSVCTASSYAAHSPNYEVDETLCDGFDNDCDSITDENCPP